MNTEMILDPLERARLGIDRAQESDLPTVVKDWLSGLNSTDNFILTPQKAREDGVLETYPAYEGIVPDQKEIGTKFGPGRWRFLIEYRPKNWDETRRGRKQGEPSDWFVLAEAGYADLHRAYKESLRDRRLNEIREKQEERAIIAPNDPLASFERIVTIATPLIAAFAPLLAKAFSPPPPPPPSDSSALLAAVVQLIGTTGKESAEQARQSQTQMIQLMADNTKTLVSLMGTRNSDSSDKMQDRMFSFMDKIIEVKTKVERMNGNEYAEGMHEEQEEKGGIDWVKILDLLGNALIPKLGMLSMLPMPQQQQLVGSELQKSPEAVEMLNAIQHSEVERLNSVRNFVKQWGIKQGRQVLDIGGIRYTEAELLEADRLAGPVVGVEASQDASAGEGGGNA